MKTPSRMDARPPWSCPRCGAPAGRPCLTNPGAKTPTLPQMHIQRWNARPTPQLTWEQVDAVFVQLVGVNARDTDYQVIRMLGGTPEVLTDYLWDHWMGEPESPTRGQVETAVEQAIEERA